jgi:hypothetical protein
MLWGSKGGLTEKSTTIPPSRAARHARRLVPSASANYLSSLPVPRVYLADSAHSLMSRRGAKSARKISGSALEIFVPPNQVALDHQKLRPNESFTFISREPLSLKGK